MLPTAIIIFRELLEVALIVGVVMAAMRGVPGRNALVLTGILIGTAGAGAIAFFADAISSAMDGLGQEIFNAGIMFTAVAVLSWSVVWMRKHGREMSQHLRQMGEAAASGEIKLYSIIVVVALAVLREGAEMVLFVYGMLLAGQETTGSIAMGAAVGAVAGTVVGLMLYYGLLKLARKHLLTVTGWLLVLLTAGMAAQGASFLVAADKLPALVHQLWDTSWLISSQGGVGTILGALIGYTDKPSGMQVLFYVTTLAVVGTLFHLSGRKPAAIPVTAS